MSRLGIIMKSKVDDLAHVLLGFEGFEAPEDFDFATTENPRAREMWNRSIQVFAHINNDPDLVSHQISRNK